MTGQVVGSLAALEAALRARLPRSGARRFVALAGPPGAGKSTLVDGLAPRLGAAVLPMDGYHLDNALLGARGDLARKGAPWTFDVGGLMRDLQRLAADDGPVLVPVFDRALDLSRAAARVIGAEARLVLVEGNYLLLDQPPWTALAPFWDVTVLIDAPRAVLEARLCQRWRDHGHDPAQALARARVNDLPNADTVLDHSRPADLVWRTG